MTASNWGFSWGDSWWGEEQLSARSRLLAFVRNTNLSALVNTFADRTEDLIDVASDCSASVDLDTCTGVHLDRLGEILQLPRYGYGDDRYRILLKIQAQLVLSSTTTTAVILEIVELFTGFPPVSYSEHYPMGFAVGAIVTAEDTPLLLEILNKAKAAAYGVTLHASDTDESLLWDYTPASPVTGAGLMDYTPASPSAGSAPMGYDHVI